MIKIGNQEYEQLRVRLQQLDWPTDNVSPRVLRDRLSPPELYAAFSPDTHDLSRKHTPLELEMDLGLGLFNLFSQGSGKPTQDSQKDREYFAHTRFSLACAYQDWGMASNENTARTMVTRQINKAVAVVAQVTGLPKPSIPRAKVHPIFGRQDAVAA